MYTESFYNQKLDTVSIIHCGIRNQKSQKRLSNGKVKICSTCDVSGPSTATWLFLHDELR